MGRRMAETVELCGSPQECAWRGRHLLPRRLSLLSMVLSSSGMGEGTAWPVILQTASNLSGQASKQMPQRMQSSWSIVALWKTVPIPPSPRGMIIPPTNRRLRGSSVEVWVFVNEVGRVVADSTRLNPPTSDRGFNRRLIEEAAEWVFNPAMKEGKPVAAWFPYTISM